MRIAEAHFHADTYYHFYNHAPVNNLLFRDDTDYKVCIGFMQRFLSAKYFQVIAYCLMPNHYHILIRQVDEYSVTESFDRIWRSYSRYYNKKYQRFGSIFCQKLQHVEIKEANHLLRLCAYIHMNPVKAGLVEHPGEWSWSNYLEWMGIRNWGLFSDLVLNCYYKEPMAYQAAIRELCSELLEKRFLHDEG